LGLGTPFWVAAFIGLLAFLLISWTLKHYKEELVAEDENPNV
jgi:protein-S-isoprenylcysteine O-methyltransferase Ste14